MTTLDRSKTGGSPMRMSIAVVLLVAALPLLHGCDRNAGVQDTARRQAVQVDLPAIAAADRAVIASAPPPVGKGQSITITDAASIQRLRQALTVDQTPPSSGMEAATIRFYQGDVLLREVWVLADGEWGFRRPGPSWTTGCNPLLFKLVQQELGPARGGE